MGYWGSSWVEAREITPIKAEKDWPNSPIQIAARPARPLTGHGLSHMTHIAGGLSLRAGVVHGANGRAAANPPKQYR